MPIARPADDGRIDLRAGRGHAGGTLLIVFVIVLFAFPLVLMVLASLRQPGLPPPHGVELVPDSPSLRAYARRLYAGAPRPRGPQLGHRLGDRGADHHRHRVVRGAGGDADGRLAPAAADPGAVPAGDGAGDRRVDSALRPLRRAEPGRHLRTARRAGVDGRQPAVRAPVRRGVPAHSAGAVRGRADGGHRPGAASGGSIALPLVRPTTAAIALLAFALFWSNFIDPLLYLNVRSAT